jgi:hypothetical protein
MPRQRIGLYDRYNEAQAQRQAAMTPEQRALQRKIDQAKKLLPVKCAPVQGDPLAIDWERHDCGYIPQTGPNGKVLPKTRERAWQMTEEKGTSGKPYLRTAVKDLALLVYRLGYRHSLIELHQESGFPDDLYWGPHGPGLLVRELKAMRPDWKQGQKQHLLSLREAGLDVGVWFPCCYLSGRIDEEMAELAGMEPRGPYARTRRGTPNPSLTWQDIADGAFNGAG